MAFGNKQNQAAPRISADRLASVAGSAAPVQETTMAFTTSRPASVEPDLSRMRPRGIDETPEGRKKRLAAKTVNFTATIIARLLIMGALGALGYDTYELTGTIPRGIALGMVAMTADLGRVLLKAMETGTK